MSAGWAMLHVLPLSVERPTMRIELLSSRISHQAPYTSGPDWAVRSEPAHAPFGADATGGCGSSTGDAG